MPIVKCNRCGKSFKEKYYEWLTAQFSYFGMAKFVCPKCYNQSIIREVKN